MAIIILAAIAFTHGAKLEKTYLPPSNARTAGGSGNFLQTPISGVSGISGPAPGSSARNTYQNVQSGFSQSGSGIPQSGNYYSQSGNDFSQSANAFAQPGAEYNNVNFNNFANEARPERPRAAFERNAAILRQDNSNDGETYSYAFETENGIYAEENGVAINGVEAQGGYSYTGDDGQVYSVRYTADQNGFVPQGDHLPTPPPVPEEILKALEQNARDEAAGIYDDGSYNEGKYAAANNNYNNQFNYQQNNVLNGNDDDTVVTNSALTRAGNAPSYNTRNGPAYNVANANGVASTYGTPNAQIGPTFNAAGIAPTYGAPNAPTFNAASIAPTYGAPNVPTFNAASIAPTYGAPNVPTFNAASIAPTYGAPNVPTFNAANSRNAPVFNAPTAGTPSSQSAFNSGSITRNSATEKAYLPPFDGPSRTRNAFGRRQQSFNARTGYNY